MHKLIQAIVIFFLPKVQVYCLAMLQEAIFPLDYVYLSEVAYFYIFFFFDKRYRGSVLRIRIKHVDSKICCRFFRSGSCKMIWILPDLYPRACLFLLHSIRE